MKTKTSSKLSILLNIILILFLMIYFLVPFSPTGFWATAFSPLCSIIKVFQGEDYIPGWCLLRDDMVEIDISDQNKNSNTNINANIDANTNTNLNTNLNVGIANPASVKCKDDGGLLEIVKGTDGEWGLCIFSDKSICEEWAYFRGECNPGKCFKECKASGTRSEGWYDSCTNKLIKYEDCVADVVTPPIAGSDITVNLPVADEQLISPFQVEGRAKTADNKIYVRVKSKSGTALIDVSGSIKNVGADGFGDFSLKINYEFSTTKEGFIEVFSKEGETEVNLVSIPVKF